MTNVSNASCRALLKHISSYLDGELDAVECAKIERHCAGCADCMQVVEGLRRTIALCRETGAAPLPPTVRDRARASIRELLAKDEGPV